MYLSKAQEEVYRDLMKILALRGRAYTFGWALGMLLQIATHDYYVRKRIKDKAQEQGPAVTND